MANANGVKNYGKQFFSGVAVLTASTVVVKLIGMLYKIPMMAYLGSTGMGYFNSAYEIYSFFFVISTTGIPVAISILVSECKAKGREREAAKIYRISMLLLAILGLVGTLVMCLFHKELARLINNDGAAYSILAISPTVLLICVGSAVRGYFQGEQKMLPTAVSQMLEALGKLLLGLGFAAIAIAKGCDAARAAACAALGLTLGVAVSTSYLLLAKLLRPSSRATDTVSLPSSSELAKKLLEIAIPITLGSTILSLTKIIDMTMILTRLGNLGYTQEAASSVYGSYSTMAVSIYNLPSTFVTAIALPLVPMLASAMESGEREREKSVIASAFKLTALISFPAGLGITTFAKPILTLLFPSQSAEIEYTAPLLAALGLSVFLSSMITVTNAVLQAYKQVRKPIISMSVGTLVKLVLSYVLIGIPSVNVLGAPISTFFSVAVIVSMNICFIIRSSGKLPQVSKIFLRPFLASVISVALGALIYAPLSQKVGKILILPVICIVAIAYLFAILKLRAVERDEILMLPRGEKIFGFLKKIHLM